MNFGQEKQLRRLVEVSALQGLVNLYTNKSVKMNERQKALKQIEDQLVQYAYPEEMEFDE
jgi:hypothetical protein